MTWLIDRVSTSVGLEDITYLTREWITDLRNCKRTFQPIFKSFYTSLAESCTRELTNAVWGRSNG